MNREMHIANQIDNKSIEFDIAVTTETTATGKVEVTVLSMILNSNLGGEIKQGEVSRIKFGVYINSESKKQVKERRAATDNAYNQSKQN